MRFSEPSYPTVFFSENIWVECPNCDQAALIRTQLPKYTIPFPHGYKSICNCKSCGFSSDKIIEWSGYFQGFVNRACGFCGSSIHYISEPTKSTFESIDLKCETCKKEKAYCVNWYRYRKNKPTDPYFGFELFLQESIKSNILWLYNLEHLKYLETYILANLREGKNRHKYSMITNLPQWIKTAKNRDLILKKIKRMEKKLYVVETK